MRVLEGEMKDQDDDRHGFVNEGGVLLKETRSEGLLVNPPAFVWGSDRHTYKMIRMSSSVDRIGVASGNACFTIDMSYKNAAEVDAVVLTSVERPWGFCVALDAFFVRIELRRGCKADEAIVLSSLPTEATYDVDFSVSGVDRFRTRYGCHGELPEHPDEIALVELVHENDTSKQCAIRVRHDCNVCTDTKMLLHFMVERDLLMGTHRQFK